MILVVIKITQFPIKFYKNLVDYTKLVNNK
jgi:hypothetical protein